MIGFSSPYYGLMANQAGGGGDADNGELLDEVQAHLRSLEADQELHKKRETILIAVCAVNDRLLACTRASFAGRAQEWQIGETEDKWLGRLDIPAYAMRFVVDAMLPASVEIHRAEVILGFSLEPLLRMEIPRIHPEFLRRPGKLMTGLLLRLYADPENKAVKAQVISGLTRVLLEERESIPTFHWWFEGLAGRVVKLHSIVVALPTPDQDLIRQAASALWDIDNNAPAPGSQNAKPASDGTGVVTDTQSVTVHQTDHQCDAERNVEIPAVADRSETTCTTTENIFGKQGSSWTVCFEGKSGRCDDSIGMYYLRELLARKGEEVAAFALRAVRPSVATITVPDWETAELELFAPNERDEKVIDDETLAVCRAAKTDLSDKLKAA